MKTIVDFDHKKATQALNFFAEKAGGAIDKLRVIKLIWLADRYHLRRYGRPIVNDVYFAMRLGPVGSNVKDLAEDPALDEAEKDYLQKYLNCNATKHKIKSVKTVDKDILSDTDLEALERVQQEYGYLATPTLIQLSHDYPEWDKFKVALTSGSSTRESMSYADFFRNPKKTTRYKNIFDESAEVLELAEEVFKENYVIANFWR